MQLKLLPCIGRLSCLAVLSSTLVAQQPAAEQGLTTLPRLTMDSPTHFHPAEWELLDTVRDRTDTLWQASTYVLLRKARDQLTPADFKVALSATPIDLFASSLERRARLVRMSLRFNQATAVELPAPAAVVTPVYSIMCFDEPSGDPVMVLSPQPPPEGLRVEQPVVAVGFFYKLWRSELAHVDLANGNPRGTFVVLVGYVVPGSGTATARGTPRSNDPAPGGDSSGPGFAIVATLLVGMLVAWYALRRQATQGRRATPNPPRPRAPDSNPQNASAFDEPIDLDQLSRPKEPDERWRGEET